MDSVRIGNICKQDRQIADGKFSALPYIGLEQVESGSGRISMESGSRSGQGEGTSFLFDNRHVLYGKLRPYLNKVAVPDFQGKCSTELVPLLPNAGIDREYLAYVLRHETTIKAVMAAVTGARMPRADMSVLFNLSVPVPSLPEQRRITDILNRAASIRRLREQAQTKAREIIPALFVEIFGDPSTNPKNWPIASIGETLDRADYGSSSKANDDPSGTPLIRMGNVDVEGSLKLDDLKYLPGAPTDHEKFALAAGDVLFNRTNSKELVGKTGLWGGEFTAVVASYFIRLRVKQDRLEPHYLWAFLNSRFMKKRLFETARGAIGQANINSKELKAFPIPLPPLSHQLKFAAHLGELEAIGRLGRDASTCAMKLSQSLTHQVFS